MKGLTHRQREALEVVITETRSVGCPPTQTRIGEVLGDTNVWSRLDALRSKGYLKQPFSGGPWIPLRTPDGVLLALKLVDGEDAAWERYVRSLTPEDLKAMNQITDVDVEAKLRAHIERLQAEQAQAS